MAARCATKGCPYYAVEGDTLCLQHRPAKVPTTPKLEEGGYAFVSMKDVPTSARYNEAAGKLFAAIKASTPGNALKVSMKIFDRITLATAQRYALASGLRIGIRIVGETGYLWKMSEEEIKRVEAKGERLRTARANKANKVKSIANKK